MTYYMHEYSQEKFETIEDCRDDLLDFVEVGEIADKLEESLTVEKILRNFLLMDGEEFHSWFTEKYWDALAEIETELIGEIEVDEEEENEEEEDE